MRTIHKSILSGGALILMMTAFATPGLAQTFNLRSSDLSTQNTQALLASRAEKNANPMASVRTTAADVERDKTMNFEMPNMAGVEIPKSAGWDSLSDEAKKAFGDQLSKGALRWSSEKGETSSSVRKENGGLFVSRGPQPLQHRVQN